MIREGILSRLVAVLHPLKQILKVIKSEQARVRRMA